VRRQVRHRVDLVYWFGGGYELFGEVALHLARVKHAPLVVCPAVHPGEWGDGVVDIEFLRRAGAVVTLSRSESEHLETRGVDRARLHVIRPGPTVAAAGDGAAFRHRYGLGDGVVVSFVGRRTAKKGLLELLDGTRDLREDGRVVLCVAGPAAETVVASAPGVIDVGVCDDVTLANLFSASDVLCVPSDSESYGLVYINAWVYGCVVVAGTAPAVRELVVHGENGFTVARSSTAIGATLERLVDRPDERLAVGLAGRDTQRDLASWEGATSRHLDLFAKLLAASRTQGAPE